MAFFKFRQREAEPASRSAPTESIEDIRRRARHRLIGAAVLVMIGVAGFPLVFDTQPRPIPVDIPIEIPDRNKVKPLAAAPVPVAQAPVVSGPVSSEPVAAAPAKPSVDKDEEIISSTPARAPASAKVATPTEPPADRKVQSQAAVDPRPESKPDAAAKAPATVTSDGARAQALLEGKAVDGKAVDGEERFIVQVGAFADVTKARETRQKVEKAGLKTYTHVAETKEGKRIRVRVGPFASKAEADRAAEKIKGLDLPAAILTL